MHRHTGFKILQTALKLEENIELVERYISNYTKNSEEYLEVVYEITHLLLSKTITIKGAIEDIYNKRYGWNNRVYDTIRINIDEEDQFAVKPFEIEEGVLECKCGSRRTISFQRQTRSADEGSTTFAHCVECGTRWRHNN